MYDDEPLYNTVLHIVVAGITSQRPSGNPTILLRNGVKEQVPKGSVRVLIDGDAIQLDRTDVTFTLCKARGRNC